MVFIWAGSGERTISTDANGLFSLEGAYGKGISISIYKKGYNIRRDGGSSGSFEYADFSQSHFHVPDKRNPYVFHLQKLISPEPLYKYWKMRKLTGDGNEIYFKLANGNFDESEELSISVKQGPSREPWGPDQVLTIAMTNGGGLIRVSNDNPAMAPDHGYSPSLQFKQNLSDANFRKDPSVYLYIKTNMGRYAWAQVKIKHNVKWQPRSEILYYYNPSGSRNLEIDEALFIKNPDQCEGIKSE